MAEDIELWDRPGATMRYVGLGLIVMFGAMALGLVLTVGLGFSWFMNTPTVTWSRAIPLVSYVGAAVLVLVTGLVLLAVGSRRENRAAALNHPDGTHNRAASRHA